jgi:hypothetical protein
LAELFFICSQGLKKLPKMYNPSSTRVFTSILLQKQK